MDVTFANPAGLWALLGIPAIIAIHFLQRESRHVVTSTLFLVEMLAPVSAEGRRIERLRNSLPLWLQLAAILLLTWILVQPLWLRANSFQSVTVVLDSSVSMEVFRSGLKSALQERLGDLSRAAKQTDWKLGESDPARPPLYAGSDLPALFSALDQWSPRLGDHDPRPALATAQSLQPPGGIVLFATDHPRPLPAGVDLLSVGEPVANCGFAGLRADADEWAALVINSSDSPQSRTWWIETAAGASAPAPLELAPGEVRTLRGRYAAARLELVLSGDRFFLDDRLPVIRPHPKTLILAVPAKHPFFDRLARSIPHAQISSENPDMTFHIYDPLAPAPIPARAIAEIRDPLTSDRYVAGEVVAENHPLTAGLNWQGLLCRETLDIPPKPGDEVLVWAGERPLVFLRGAPGAQSLVLNFPISQSNADRLPAFIVLLNRFVESTRAAKVAREALNVETNQSLEVPAAAGPALTLDGVTSAAGNLHAPDRPRFFSVSQAGNVLVEGAAHFADSREADFRRASPADTLVGRMPTLIQRNRRSDFLTPWFILLLVALCLANWAATGAPTRSPDPMIAPVP